MFCPHCGQQNPAGARYCTRCGEQLSGASPVLTSSSSYPVPPHLHWALVLVAGMFSGFLFVYIWLFIQSSFVKRLDPASKATLYFATSLAISVLSVAILIAGYIAIVLASGGADITTLDPGTLLTSTGFGVVLYVASTGFFLAGVLSMRQSLLQHYNGAENIGLRLSLTMSLLFSVLYFQYHFSRIAEWRTTGVLSPQ